MNSKDGKLVVIISLVMSFIINAPLTWTFIIAFIIALVMLSKIDSGNDLDVDDIEKYTSNNYELLKNDIWNIIGYASLFILLCCTIFNMITCLV